MFDLFLPKRLSFKVTPKGVVSHKRVFNLASAKGLVIATMIYIIAIIKGLAEFFYFGIEKDAYFFNLGWASINLLFLLVGLLIAWEKPQRRAHDRIRKAISLQLRSGGFSLEGETRDMSLSGVSFITKTTSEIPALVEMTILDTNPITCQCRLIHHEKVSRHTSRVGLAFVDLARENYRKLVLNLFASPETWKGVHEEKVRSKVWMMFHFFRGVVRCLMPLRNQTRRCLRKKTVRVLSIHVENRTFKVLLRDFSQQGYGFLHFGKEAPTATTYHILEGRNREMDCFQVYRKKLMPYIWRVGLRVEQDVIPTLVTRADSAAHCDLERGEQV